MVIASQFQHHAGTIMHSFERDMARAIVSYLMDHKEAADTREGIMRWWILNETIKQRLTSIQGAIAYLLREGWIQQRQLPGTHEILLSLNPSRIDQLQEWIRQPE